MQYASNGTWEQFWPDACPNATHNSHRYCESQKPAGVILSPRPLRYISHL